MLLLVLPLRKMLLHQRIEGILETQGVVITCQSQGHCILFYANMVLE